MRKRAGYIWTDCKTNTEIEYNPSFGKKNTGIQNKLFATYKQNAS